jgi:hypothetical protein
MFFSKMSHKKRGAMSEINLKPTKEMVAAFKKGLRLHELGRSGDGLMPATVLWARKAVNGESLTADKVRKMNAWFARHSVDEKAGWDKPGSETPGYVAWLLWGGDAGQAWSKRKAEELDKQK